MGNNRAENGEDFDLSPQAKTPQEALQNLLRLRDFLFARQAKESSHAVHPPLISGLKHTPITLQTTYPYGAHYLLSLSIPQLVSSESMAVIHDNLKMLLAFLNIPILSCRTGADSKTQTYFIAFETSDAIAFAKGRQILAAIVHGTPETDQRLIGLVSKHQKLIAP